MPNPAERHWSEGVHLLEAGWVYLGSYNLGTGQKGDVYYDEDIDAYEGISIQYGPDEHQYYSSSHIYLDDLSTSPLSCILKAYAMKYGRGIFRNETEDNLNRFKHIDVLVKKKDEYGYITKPKIK